MSLQYKIFRAGILLAGIKTMFRLSKEGLLQKVIKTNKQRSFRMLRDHKCVYGDQIILEKYHCLTMQTSPRKSEKTILFLFGGGCLMGPGGMDIAAARKLGRKSGAASSESLRSVIATVSTVLPLYR